MLVFKGFYVTLQKIRGKQANLISTIVDCGFSYGSRSRANKPI